MKNSWLLFLSLIVLVSCDDDDEDDNPNGGNQTNIETISEFMTNSNGLEIALLLDDEDNETDLFAGYRFFFSADNSITAINNADTVLGTYSIFQDEGRTELAMDFVNTGFAELNDDWYFESINGAVIRFADEDEILEFSE